MERNSSSIWVPVGKRRFPGSTSWPIRSSARLFPSRAPNLSGAAIARTIASRRGSTIRSLIRPEPPSTSAMMTSASCGRPRRNRSLRDPAAMEHEQLTGDVGAGLDPCAAVQVVVEIEPRHTVEVTFLLGQADDEETARGLVTRFRDPANVEAAFQETRRWWERLLSTVEVETPELSTNFLLNRWLLYQTLSCRMWGRSALYQSSGAYGFRDQLQDVMALVHSAPQLARDHILRAAARQFVEGDVQHWWHPESGT